MSLLRQIFPPEPESRGSPCPDALHVSPEGELLVPGTPAFYDRIGYRNPDFDLGDYAIRNMGFVSIARLSADRVRLRFRPDLVGGRTIEAVCRYLVQRQFESVELSYLGRSWIVEMWPNDPALFSRLVDLCTKPVKPTNEAPYHIEALELNSAVEDYSHPLKPMLQKWRTAFGEFNETTLPFFQRFGFFSKLIIAGMPRPGAPLRFEFLGSGIQVYDEENIFQLVGQPVTDQPDKDYGAWVNAQYSALLESRQPRLDCVDASVRYSHNQMRTMRYERLLLPWRGSNGACLITIASVLLSEERVSIANDNIHASSGSLDLLRRPSDENLRSRQELQGGLACERGIDIAPR